MKPFIKQKAIVKSKRKSFSILINKNILHANVLVSVLNKEYPTFSYSSRLFNLPQNLRKFEFYTSPICLAIAYYFAENKSKSAVAEKKEISVTIYLF